MSERENGTTAPSSHLMGSEAEELAEINAALKTINDTCIALQYDDRGRYGVETIAPLRNVAKLINKLVFLSAAKSAPSGNYVSKPDIRKLAVEIVDGLRGYTYEFSSHPAAHREDYDFIEQKLRTALATATSEGGE